MMRSAHLGNQAYRFMSADTLACQTSWRLRTSMLFGFPVALDLLGERPFVDFGRAVIDTEGADLAESLLDDRLGRDARTSHHLHAAIAAPHQGFPHRHFGRRTLGRP